MENMKSIEKIVSLVHGCAHTNVVGATSAELVQSLHDQANLNEDNSVNVLLVSVLDKAQAVVEGALTPHQMRDFFVDVATRIAGSFDVEDELEFADSISKTAGLLSHISIH